MSKFRRVLIGVSTDPQVVAAVRALLLYLVPVIAELVIAWLAGIAVAFLAYGFATTLDRAHGMTWTLPVLGVWVIVATGILPDVELATGILSEEPVRA